MTNVMNFGRIDLSFQFFELLVPVVVVVKMRTPVFVCLCILGWIRRVHSAADAVPPECKANPSALSEPQLGEVDYRIFAPVCFSSWPSLFEETTNQLSSFPSITVTAFATPVRENTIRGFAGGMAATAANTRVTIQMITSVAIKQKGPFVAIFFRWEPHV